MNALKVIIRIYSNFISCLYCAIRLLPYRLTTKEKNDEVWLIEGICNYPAFFNIYYYLKASFALGKKPQLVFINTQLRFYRSHPRLKSKVMNVITQNRFLVWCWRLMYFTTYQRKWEDLACASANSKEKAVAQTILASLKTKRDLEQLRMNGLWVGDLMYDTYLRFKPAATVDLNDPFLLELIEFTVAAIPYLEKIFLKHKVNQVLTVYTSYLQHGLISRLAIKYKLNVHAVGVSHQLVCRPTEDFPYHMRNYYRYKEWFKSQPDREKNLARGREIIETRMAGKLDRTSYYMTRSSFAKDLDPTVQVQLEALQNDSRKKIVFMCHDFFDSPHGTRSMLYPDFYEWLLNTLEYSNDSPYQFLVKPHPNSAHSDTAILKNFKERFPKITVLDKKFSNHYLKQLDIQYILTVYGTVAYEFSAMGYTVLCCGENAHSDYNFSVQIKSIERLKSVLQGREIIQSKIDMNEIYEFLFVQNYRYDRGEVHPFPWDFRGKEMLRLIQNDDGKTELMKRAILDIDSI